VEGDTLECYSTQLEELFILAPGTGIIVEVICQKSNLNPRRSISSRNAAYFFSSKLGFIVMNVVEIVLKFWQF